MDVYRLTNRTPARISSSFSSSVFHTGSAPSSRLRSRSPAWALSWSSVLEIGTAWTHASVDRRTATMEVEAESFITEGRVGSLQGIQERRTFVDRGNCSYIRSPEANCREEMYPVSTRKGRRVTIRSENSAASMLRVVFVSAKR